MVLLLIIMLYNPANRIHYRNNINNNIFVISLSLTDCRIKVAVTQVKNNALSTVVKRTRVRRHTRQPVFKESMSFEINDLNNLRDGMTVVCSLSGESLTRKPQTIGQVRFGLGASRDTEKLQWANVLRNPGLSITQWHTL